MNRNSNILILFFVTIFFFSCQEETDERYIPNNKKKTQRILIYMITDNNLLDYFAMRNINEMEEGLFYADGLNGEIWVYIDRGKQGIPAHPYLMQLRK